MAMTRYDETLTVTFLPDPLLNSKDINQTIKKMASNIHDTLRDTALLILTLYPNGSHFSDRLTEKLDHYDLTLEENYIDFNIENETIILRVEPLISLEGRTVLITDVLLKEGRTMQAAIDYCKSKGARVVYCAVLIDMPNSRAKELETLNPTFYGAICADQTLIGFGLPDKQDFFRNNRSIWTTTRSSSAHIQFNSLNKKTSLQPAPLVLQENIQPSEAALIQAQQAEQTFSQLNILVNKQELKEKITLVANEIAEKFKDAQLIVLTLQKGGSHFTTRLTEYLSRSALSLQEGYLHLTRYGNNQQGGDITVIAEPNINLKDRIVIISDDLIEGGLTLKTAKDICLEKGAKEVFIVTMGNKPHKRLNSLKDFQPDLCCFSFDENVGFLVGVGLDEKEYGRNRLNIGAIPKLENKLVKCGLFSTGAPTTDDDISDNEEKKIMRGPT